MSSRMNLAAQVLGSGNIHFSPANQNPLGTVLLNDYNFYVSLLENIFICLVTIMTEELNCRFK